MAVPASINDCSTTIASNSPAGSDFISGNLDDYIRAHAGIMRQESQAKGWLPYGDSTTYSSATVFTVSSDLRTRYAPGRPIKATVTAGIAYGVIVQSTFSVSTTTVTVITDIGLDSGLSRVDIGEEVRAVQSTRNALINSWFRFWQRNTTFTTSAYLNVADGWAASPGAGGTVTFSRTAHTVGQTSVPFEPPYYATWDQTVGGTVPGLHQRVEDVRSFAGQSATIWVMASVSSGSIAVTPRVIQYFGTGGSPSTNATTDGTAITITTTPKLFACTIPIASISGKTIGTDLNSSCVRFGLIFPSATTFTAQIYCMGVTGSPFAAVERPRPEGEELMLCQRRVYKTFHPDTVPAQNTGVRVGTLAYSCIQAGANSYLHQHPLPVPLRTREAAAATVTTYSVGAATSAWYNGTDGAASGAAAVAVVGGVTLYPSDVLSITNAQAAGDGVGEVCMLHAMVDAEFNTASI